MSGSNGHPETVSPELLQLLRTSRQAADIAQIEFNGIVNHVLQQYGAESVDLATGVITRKPEAAQPAQ